MDNRQTRCARLFEKRLHFFLTINASAFGLCQADSTTVGFGSVWTVFLAIFATLWEHKRLEGTVNSGSTATFYGSRSQLGVTVSTSSCCLYVHMNVLSRWILFDTTINR